MNNPKIPICCWCLGLGFAAAQIGSQFNNQREVQRCDTCNRFHNDEAAELTFFEMFSSIEDYDTWRDRVQPSMEAQSFIELVDLTA